MRADTKTPPPRKSRDGTHAEKTFPLNGASLPTGLGGEAEAERDPSLLLLLLLRRLGEEGEGEELAHCEREGAPPGRREREQGMRTRLRYSDFRKKISPINL